MLISVAIPTHNRPEFLLEAVHSVANQTYEHWEVVVIDDGSTPEISREILQSILGQRVRLYRHEVAQGVSKAKNAAIQASRGEVIVLLDDDDLFTHDALETIHRAYLQHPELDCLFLGVERIGQSHTAASEGKKSLKRILSNTNPLIVDDLYLFGDQLFNALLQGVPIEFQRPAARRGTWNLLGLFDEESLYSESSWAIRAAAFCGVGLTQKIITKWRIHGSNFGYDGALSREENLLRKARNDLDNIIHLLGFFQKKKSALSQQVREIRKRTSLAYFGMAYHLRKINRIQGIKCLLNALFLYPQWRYFRLLLTYSIPVSILNLFGNKS